MSFPQHDDLSLPRLARGACVPGNTFRLLLGREAEMLRKEQHLRPVLHPSSSTKSNKSLLSLLGPSDSGGFAPGHVAHPSPPHAGR